MEFSRTDCNALIQHYLDNGATAHVHGNKNRIPKDALSVDDMERVVTFIQNYAEEHGVLLPGTVPGYSRDDLKLLPWICVGSANRAMVYIFFNRVQNTAEAEKMEAVQRIHQHIQQAAGERANYKAVVQKTKVKAISFSVYCALSLSENPESYVSFYFADFVCCKDLDSNSFLFCS